MGERKKYSPLTSRREEMRLRALIEKKDDLITPSSEKRKTPISNNLLTGGVRLGGRRKTRFLLEKKEELPAPEKERREGRGNLRFFAGEGKGRGVGRQGGKERESIAHMEEREREVPPLQKKGEKGEGRRRVYFDHLAGHRKPALLE